MCIRDRFYISGLEPYFSVYQDDFNKSSITKVDLAKASAIYKFARTTSMVVDTQEITVESPYYEGEEFKYIDTYDKDLAIWMDPNAMMSMAMTIRDTFVSTYPENAAVFEDNYSKLEVEFAQLDACLLYTSFWHALNCRKEFPANLLHRRLGLTILPVLPTG